MSNTCSTHVGSGLLSDMGKGFLMSAAIGSGGCRGAITRWATHEGDYLGTIVDVNRFYHFADRPRRPNPGFPERPTYPALPDSPGLAARAVLPVGATDVASLEKSRD